MNNIIKRRKTSSYAQIHNKPLQGDLEDLRAVGLLAHIMSLPEDWTIHKTQLHTMYSRRNVDAGWKELAERNYVVGFSCYVDGRKNYFYNVSDVSFTQTEFEEFATEQIKELQNCSKSVKNPSVINHSNLAITEKITGVLIVQHSTYCTDSAYTKEIENKETETNKHLNTFVNKENHVDNSNGKNVEDSSERKKQETIHKLTNEYRLLGLKKDVCLRVLKEVEAKGDEILNFGAYLRNSLATALYKAQVKQGIIEPNADEFNEAVKGHPVLYNWLEQR